MYKDPDKQREANRQWMRRARQVVRDQALKRDELVSQNAQGLPVVDEVGPDDTVIPSDSVIPERTAQGNVRVSKPGDSDYEPQCETTRAFIEGRDKRPEPGKDIKTFADLPPDVQQTIDTLSDDKAEHKRRTAIAINYQHQFPDRFHSVGVI